MQQRPNQKSQQTQTNQKKKKRKDKTKQAVYKIYTSSYKKHVTVNAMTQRKDGGIQKDANRHKKAGMAILLSDKSTSAQKNVSAKEGYLIIVKEEFIEKT